MLLLSFFFLSLFVAMLIVFRLKKNHTAAFENAENIPFVKLVKDKDNKPFDV
jgi:hypothetical protein